MLKSILSENTLEELQQLVDERILEGSQLDYKSVVEEDKLSELVDDIVAFANVAGGDLVIGLPEARDEWGEKLGYPARLQGIEVNFSEFKAKVENAVRDLTEPRIRGIQFHPISVDEGKTVVIVRVPRSWSGPHAVRRKGGYRFVSRNSAGTFGLDWAQIRDAFAGTDGLTSRMAEFRIERIGRILAGETPVPTESTGKFVLHVMPVDTFIGGAPPVSEFYRCDHLFRPPYTSASTGLLTNFDGLFAARRRERSEPAIGYLQSFRNGALEGVQGEPLIGPMGSIHPQVSQLVIAERIDAFLLQGVDNYQRLLKHLGVTPPCFVGITFVGVKGYCLEDSFDRRKPQGIPIDRDVLMLPEIELERFDFSFDELAERFHEPLDMLWQACGHVRCPYFDETTDSYISSWDLEQGKFRYA